MKKDSMYIAPEILLGVLFRRIELTVIFTRAVKCNN